MRIDFTPLTTKAVTPVEFASQFGLDELREVVNEYLDWLRTLAQEFNDEQLTFEPVQIKFFLR